MDLSIRSSRGHNHILVPSMGFVIRFDDRAPVYRGRSGRRDPGPTVATLPDGFLTEIRILNIDPDAPLTMQTKMIDYIAGRQAVSCR